MPEMWKMDEYEKRMREVSEMNDLDPNDMGQDDYGDAKDLWGDEE